MINTRDELLALRRYIESKHNGYDEESRKAMGMQKPATHLDALRQLVEEHEDLERMELRDARAEVERVTKREADGVELYDELLARERAIVQVQRTRADRAEAELARMQQARNEALLKRFAGYAESYMISVGHVRDEIKRLTDPTGAPPAAPVGEANRPGQCWSISPAGMHCTRDHGHGGVHESVTGFSWKDPPPPSPAAKARVERLRELVAVAQWSAPKDNDRVRVMAEIVRLLADAAIREGGGGN